MKAIRFKLRLTPGQIQQFDNLRKQLTLAWNLAHKVAILNRSVEWWKWAEKAAKKDKSWDLEGCTMTEIKLSKTHAFSGAYCEIVRDGGWWGKDETQPLIEYRGKKIATKDVERVKPAEIYWQDGVAFHKLRKFPMTKWVEPKDGRVARNVANIPFQYMREPSVLAGGKEIQKVTQLDSKTRIKQFGIELPPKTSDFLGGMLKQFEESYKAWVDTKRSNAHKPRWRDINRPDDWLRSLYNTQTSPSKFYDCTAASLEFVSRDGQEFIDIGGIFGAIELYRGELSRVPEGLIPRSYILTQDASGYYLSVVFATRLEVAAVMIGSKVKRPAKDATDEEKEAVKLELACIKSAIAAENYDPGNGKTLGIDPGVVRQITAHDGAKTFHIKLAQSRHTANQRLTKRIDRLKSKLSKIKTRNNVRYELEPDHKRSAGLIKVNGQETILKNEAKLQQRIRRLQLLRANRRKAYQHQVSVRLFSMGYSEIRFEKTQVSNMNKAAKPQLGANGKYKKNNAAAKSGLNQSLADTAMAAQAEKIKYRYTTAGRTFTEVPAANTSQRCHCCGEKGDRASQELFRCLNTLCELFNLPQNADDNASKNIYRADRVVENPKDLDEMLD